MDREKQKAPEDPEMNALQTAARLIMENGGETFRAEETVRRMGNGFGLEEVESFAVPSGLFISYRRPDGQLETSVKRVHRGGTDLTKVDAVNSVSRDVTEGKMNAAEATGRLREIESQKQRPWKRLWAAAICAGGFAFLFQGGLPEAAVCAVTAMLVQGMSLLLEKLHDSGIASTILGGLLTALLPGLTAPFLPGLNAEAAVAAALMPLVPGLAMTNAVQDTLRGDMVSGLSHGASALLTACLIAGGALLASTLQRLMTGGGL